MPKQYVDKKRKKGTADLLVLALVAERRRHGYEIAKLIAERSGGTLSFRVASLYPLLYRLERKGWIKGKWVEKPSERRRRFYSLTAAGRRQLKAEQANWLEFVIAVQKITGFEHA